ncbi:uncharacterized protein PFL1_00548 [Pseudozyma flocculosa PF-1]|uniref:Uncharacterized protein n=1 Tax=Pseudozyma flocculosa TaxID=84751 RepID=A0A5C3ET38_9BASI|nr:uncharacterized protein PFL1_00548 [Pseudozyma flocculosa PF-1]EPQ32352.1 hypothetical protein PFL1_00548 [Pseudozyma flocculosa PF-1]SPO34686.1 uncharacterized protein PSFLO_00157 [Pseudozyma flocculosa]
MASTGGGFLIDDFSSILPDAPADAAASEQHADESVQASTFVPQPLSAKQEARLRSYLDNSLLVISRGYRKRFDPSSPLPSLIPFWQQWNVILGVLARVPPYGSGGTNLLVSYLLRCTSDICDGIAGYGLGMEIERARRESRQKGDQAPSKARDEAADAYSDRPGAEDGEDGEDQHEDEEQRRRQEIALRNKQLNLVLEATSLLDRMWTAILRGYMINFPVALKRAREAFSDADDSSNPTEQGRNGKASLRSTVPGIGRFTSSLVPSPAVDGRFLSTPHSSALGSERESLPIQGGKGIRTVGQTDRVRLRNIAVLAREKLFAWMREELNAPLPPTMDEDEEDDGQATAGDIVPGVVADQLDEENDGEEQREMEADEDLEGEMEDVPIGDAQADPPPAIEPEGETYDPQEDTAEHRHFQELFDRKIDPDADESDEAPDERESSPLRDPSPVDSRSTKRPHSPNPASPSQPSTSTPTTTEPPRKAARAAQQTSASAHRPHRPTQSETASADVDLYSDSVVQWDLAFTRIFSRTLKTLSDLAESAGGSADPARKAGSGGIGLRGGEMEDGDGDADA